LNEPSLRKFLPAVEPNGLVIYNGDSLPAGCERPDVRLITAPFAQIADQLGSARAANIVILGALLQAGRIPFDAQVPQVLRKLVHSPKWLEIDLAALESGRRAAQNVANQEVAL
jgi:Pyruvate/2-oxoacid:ferredoxin oxidoreductase gamma subunit